ncbi:uncharacterized protein L201_000937 [Kwoniella dendrophila CBS 6074]|uniref:Phenazine biosynthesis protein n=1 Tax=Kwoniella dendrophila CBS 6074 TaxID=1295534 RepID=A0AAX4JL08_9TREE
MYYKRAGDAPLPFHVLSAFSPLPGTGSQAALIIYPSTSDPRWLNDNFLLKISADFNYTATVHLAPSPISKTLDEDKVAIIDENPLQAKAHHENNEKEEGSWEIRWFTPKSELALCGHGTISTSYILFKKYPNLEVINYINPIAGKFSSKRISNNNKQIEISLPGLTEDIINQLGQDQIHKDQDKLKIAFGLNKDDEDSILNVSELPYGNKKTLIILFRSDIDLRSLNVDIKALGEIADGQIIISQISTESKETLIIRSRMFGPGIGIQEDTITGSAHAYLTTYYLQSKARRFIPEHLQQKDPREITIEATQLSERGGGMNCILGDNNTVRLIGKVREFGKGQLVDDDDDS